jgi:hypothetical protein
MTRPLVCFTRPLAWRPASPQHSKRTQFRCTGASLHLPESLPSKVFALTGKVRRVSGLYRYSS